MRLALAALLAGGCECDGTTPAPPDCDEGRTACGRACVLVSEDPAHCGGCGHACTAAELCHGGACRDECPAGTSPCGRTCRSLQTDPFHCGACDAACAEAQICDRGACACPEGLTACDGTCVDASTDVANCGACAEDCAAGETCVGGACGCARERRETTCDDEGDDDCDGLADCADPDCAGSVTACDGACGVGVASCEGDARGPCAQGEAAAAEVCGNGIDDDCDGESLGAPDDLEPTDACDECYRLGTDVTFEVSATIDSVLDASDCYSFEGVDDVAYAERIDVALGDLGAGVDLDLHLYRGLAACEARTPVASSTAGAGEPETIAFVETLDADDSAEWYVRVVRVAGWSCDAHYSLRVEGLD
jgi:hypothetical protein